MLQLNTSPAVLEVLGAPVAGSDVRASVMTGAPACGPAPESRRHPQRGRH